MRINRYVAQASGLSRRAADKAVTDGRVTVNGQPVNPGAPVEETATVTLDGQPLRLPTTTTILFNKPIGVVCSRNGQGSRTIYDLLPPELRHLKPVGRLDKDSSGLLLLTNDGILAHQLTHPSFLKAKVYQIQLNNLLSSADQTTLAAGVQLEDGPSHLQLDGQGNRWTVTMHEGRNRQIRRTFAALGYTVIALHRTHFASYTLEDLAVGHYRDLS